MRTKLLFFLSAFIAALSAIIFTLFFFLNDYIQLDEKIFALDGNNVYYALLHDANPMQTSLEDFEKIYKCLQKPEIYTYYEMGIQPLTVSSSTALFFDSETEQLCTNPQQILCAQISKNVQEDFDFSVSDGRLLTSYDFEHKKNTSIPVLLGNDYKGAYQIGQTFEAEYLYATYTFEIIGIIAPYKAIENSMRNIVLDKYIVMPSFFIQKTGYPPDGSQIHYANKTSPIIKCSKEKSSLTENFLNEFTSSSVADGGYFWNSSSVSKTFENAFGFTLHIFRKICVVLMLILLILLIPISIKVFSVFYLKKQFLVCWVSRMIIYIFLCLAFYTFFASLLSKLFDISMILFYYHNGICFNIIYVLAFQIVASLLIVQIKKLVCRLNDGCSKI